MSREIAIVLAVICLGIAGFFGFKYVSTQSELKSTSEKLANSEDAREKCVNELESCRLKAPPIGGYLKAKSKLLVAETEPKCVGLSYDNTYDDRSQFVREISCDADDSLRGEQKHVNRISLLLKWRENWSFYVDFEQPEPWSVDPVPGEEKFIVKGLMLKAQQPGRVDSSSYRFEEVRGHALRNEYKIGVKELFTRQSQESRRATEAFMRDSDKMKVVFERARAGLVSGIKKILNNSKHPKSGYEVEVIFANQN